MARHFPLRSFCANAATFSAIGKRIFLKPDASPTATTMTPCYRPCEVLPSGKPQSCSIEIMRAMGLLLLFALTATAGDDLRPQVDAELPALLAIYRDLHAHPELSHHEERTSALLAGELRKAGYTVTEHLGKYSDGSPAFGIVGVMKNGSGPTVLVRTELDALPVEEKTGAPFASQVRGKNAAGQDVGVMHACGHDLHMMSLLGTAQALAKL